MSFSSFWSKLSDTTKDKLEQDGFTDVPSLRTLDDEHLGVYGLRPGDIARLRSVDLEPSATPPTSDVGKRCFFVSGGEMRCGTIATDAQTFPFWVSGVDTSRRAFRKKRGEYVLEGHSSITSAFAPPPPPAAAPSGVSSPAAVSVRASRSAAASPGSSARASRPSVRVPGPPPPPLSESLPEDEPSQ